MPIFNFRCTSCDRIVEKILLHKVEVNMQDQIDAVIKAGCECGGKITPISGVPSLKFVGKDFYVTEERARKERMRVANDVAKANKRISQSKPKNG